jgi:hypothetical protein
MVPERQPVADPAGAMRSDPAPAQRCRRSDGLDDPVSLAQLPAPRRQGVAGPAAIERSSGGDAPDDPV